MPAADGEGVVVTFGHSHVVLLDPAGHPRWTVDHPSVRDVASRLTADAVLVPTEEGLLALDRATGAPRWEARIGERANTPVIAGGRAVASTWDGSLVAFGLADGRVAWRVPLPGVALGPASGDDRVVVTTWEAEHGAGAGALAVDPATGRQRWAVPLPEGGVSGPGMVAAAGERLAVVIAGDIAAHALASDSGEERWSTPLEGAGSPEVVPLDAGRGAVLLGHRLGGLVLLDGADGRVRWKASSDGAAVRGGPAGPGPEGAYALPLDDGRLLLAGPERPAQLLDPPGRVSGVASGPGGTLLVATREAAENDLTALSGW
jgi:outer membrane protein assembly factor BamB